MSFESTPTTEAELAAALALVSAAQDPLPWDVNYFWPRVVGAPAIPQMAVYNSGRTVATIFFDDDLSSTTPGNGNWEVIVESASPGVFHRKVVTVDEITDNQISLNISGTTVDPGPAQVTYSGDDAPPLADAQDQLITPFSMGMKLAS